MKYKMIFLPEAEKDSQEIRQYLSQYYENTAQNFFALLKKRINMLKSNPLIAQVCQERPPYRRLVVESYILFYRVDEVKKLIEIHRILHGSMDIGRYI